MAAQGGGVLFQEKVSRLLSKRDGKAVLKPNRPLALRDAVANRKLKKGGETAEDWGLRDVMTPAPKRYLTKVKCRRTAGGVETVAQSGRHAVILTVERDF